MVSVWDYKGMGVTHNRVRTILVPNKEQYDLISYQIPAGFNYGEANYREIGCVVYQGIHPVFGIPGDLKTREECDCFMNNLRNEK